MNNVDELSNLIAKELKEYKDNIRNGIQEAVCETMKELVANTKADAPINTGKYKKSIASKENKTDYNEYKETWYVKDPRYRIAHLLDKGHAKRTGGRVQGDGHITKNAEKAEENFAKRVEEVIKKS